MEPFTMKEDKVKPLNKVCVASKYLGIEIITQEQMYTTQLLSSDFQHVNKINP